MPAGRGKADAVAKRTLGYAAYQAIPKSTFALLAYHLALRLTGCEDHAEALALLRDEADALGQNGILTQSQLGATLRAIPHEP